MRALRPLLERGDLSEAERMRRLGLALDALNTIARLLEAVGAQTRPA